jgi:hypothetical protein
MQRFNLPYSICVTSANPEMVEITVVNKPRKVPKLNYNFFRALSPKKIFLCDVSFLQKYCLLFSKIRKCGPKFPYPCVYYIHYHERTTLVPTCNECKRVPSGVNFSPMTNFRDRPIITMDGEIEQRSMQFVMV